MKKTTILVLIWCSALLFSGCGKKEQAPTTAKETTAPAPTQPAIENTTNVPIAPAAPGGTTGNVVETMNAAGYTYVFVDDGRQKIWAAAPEFSVSVGDQVIVPEGMAMHNYHSQTLNRDFPVVYFVESVLNASNPSMTQGGSQALQMPAGHPPISGIKSPQGVDLSNITKADGGQTIAEIYAGGEANAGQDLTVRAKVVKFSPQIMGTNWIHIQDGSGDKENGTNDLTVTSNVEVQVGDTVLVSGALTLNKDFGYGYKYAAIMENATVKVE